MLKVARIESGMRIDDLREAIECSIDGLATIWEYSVSLSQLTIRISWSGKSENLHFVCNGCERMEMPSVWDNLNFVLQKSDHDLYRLEDHAAKFLLECRSIRVFRNVEPMFATS